ncbi:MAG: hypothetical protein CL609_10245 [Anaerolineaceae bacterium]|nr:hypothetical protein [Anaerolineaceae bacterium]
MIRLARLGLSLIFMPLVFALTFTTAMDVDCEMRNAPLCYFSVGCSDQNYGLEPDNCTHCTSVFPETAYQVLPAHPLMVFASSAPFVKTSRASQLLRPPIGASLNQTA